MVADDNYWRALALEAAGNDGISTNTYEVEKKRYKAAVARAQVYGYIYKTVETLAKEETTEQILDRIAVLKGNTETNGMPHPANVDALLGGTPEPTKPKVRVSEAFEIYLDKIAFDEIAKKSEKQRYSWKKTKRTSVNYFIEVIGDKDIASITREDAIAYRSWWIERMLPRDEQAKPAKPNTANRHIGNMRKLYEDYFTYIGEEEHPNPFRKMFLRMIIRTAWCRILKINGFRPIFSNPGSLTG